MKVDGYFSYDERVNRNSEPVERYSNFVEVYNLNRPFYGEQTNQIITENDINCKKLADEYGYNPSVFTRLKGPTFVASPVLLSIVCELGNMSCHDFIFTDETKPTILPRSLSLTAKTVSDSMIHEKNAIVEYVKKFRADYETEHGPFVIKTPQVAGYRHKEFAKEQYLPVNSCLNKSAGIPISIKMARLIARDEQTFDKDKIRLECLMYIAWVIGTTIDYFVVQDYTKYQPIGYRYGDRVVKITDTKAIYVVSQLLHLPYEKQAECIAYILYHYGK